MLNPEPAPDDDAEPDLAWPDPTQRDRDAVQRAGRDFDSPVMPAELSALIRVLRSDLGQQLRAALDKRIAPLERDFGPVRRFTRWAMGGAAIAVVSVVGFAYARGQAEQHVTDEIQHQREQISELKDRLEALRTTKDPRP